MSLQDAAPTGASAVAATAAVPTGSGLTPIEDWFAGVVPAYGSSRSLQVLVLVVAAVLAASIVSWFLKRVVAGLLSKTKTTFDDDLLRVLTPPIYTSVIAIGLRLALHRLAIQESTITRSALVIGTLVVLVWLIAAIQAAGLVFSALSRNADRFALIKPTTLPLFDNLSKVVLVVVAAYLVLNLWDQDLSGLLAAGGIAGLAIGFAARDTLANLFAGVFIFADSPYQVGDFINLDSGERGMVTDIGLRSTRLLTRDDVQITIPNSVMGSAKIINESGGPHPKFRLRAPVGAAYGSDIDLVRQVLLDVAANEPLVCREPEPRVRFRKFGDSSLDFELLCWVEEPVIRGRALDQLNTAIYKQFAAKGIEIPYPKRDVYVRELPRT